MYSKEGKVATETKIITFREMVESLADRKARPEFIDAVVKIAWMVYKTYGEDALDPDFSNPKISYTIPPSVDPGADYKETEEDFDE